MDRSSLHSQLVRVAAVQGIDAAIRHFDADVDTVFRAAGLEQERFEDGDQLVALRDLGCLLERASVATNCRLLPFYLAENQDLAYLGTFGLLLQTSDTVGQMLREIQDYHQVHVQAATWTMSRSGDTASLEFWMDSRDVTPQQRRLLVELALAQAYKLVELLVGGDPCLKKVRLNHECGQERQAYRHFFRAPVEYNAEANGLDFPEALLDKPVSPNNGALHELVLQKISGDLSDRQQDLAHGVSVIIRSLLPTGQCTVERVASYYACDKRTLQRYLREESDTTYQAILDDVRFSLVQNYLLDSSMSMTQLSFIAGYTDTSNFSRAFSKRFGMSPRQWRSEHGAAKSSSANRRRGPG
ncbi:hypothetical protein NOR53_2492 [gamma proteobacterium NOR5-3]|nr:hypothetical protein NOR53_2492 [gamma proteobacterium NOR5-3]